MSKYTICIFKVAEYMSNKRQIYEDIIGMNSSKHFFAFCSVTIYYRKTIQTFSQANCFFSFVFQKRHLGMRIKQNHQTQQELLPSMAEEYISRKRFKKSKTSILWKPVEII